MTTALEVIERFREIAFDRALSGDDEAAHAIESAANQVVEEWAATITGANLEAAAK